MDNELNEAAEICAEMAREEEKNAKELHGSVAVVDIEVARDDIATALREAERRIRARMPVAADLDKLASDITQDVSVFFLDENAEYNITTLLNIIRRHLMAAPSLSQWQPIESPPTNDDDVLVLLSDGNMEVGFWRDDAKGFDSTSAGWLKNATHWQPLPLPLNPKERA